MAPSLGLVIMLCCAVFYYRVGEAEHASGRFLCALSVAVWLITSWLLGWGLFGCLLAQAGIFAGLTVWNMYKKK